MREIEFRAKRPDNNEWLYGFYSPRIWFPTFEQTPNIKTFKGTDVEIDINTLGQYTGLKDKNGTKIFEGDIIKGITEDTNQEVFGVIRFGKYLDCNFEDSAMGFYFECDGCQYSMFNGEAQGFDLPSLVEVIGNIYDNPELIKE